MDPKLIVVDVVVFRGIVPITCDELFKIIERGDGSIVSFFSTFNQFCRLSFPLVLMWSNKI